MNWNVFGNVDTNVKKDQEELNEIQTQKQGMGRDDAITAREEQERRRLLLRFHVLCIFRRASIKKRQGTYGFNLGTSLQNVFTSRHLLELQIKIFLI